MHKYNLKGIASFLIVIIITVLIPQILASPTYMHIFIMVCIGSICAIGWRFVFNMGQINFGPAGFVGVGAYASALLMMRLGISFWFALPLTGLVTAFVAMVIGYPTLRLRGLYFAITTFAFQEILRSIWLRFKVPFGGAQGIYNIPVPNTISLGFAKIEFNNVLPFYYLVLFVLFITVLFFSRVDKSRLGMTLKAIREADGLSECVGVNVIRYQVLGWSIASFFTGMAGSLYAHYVRFIDPFTFGMFLTIDIIAYAIVGGTDFAWGPVIGSLILVFIGETLHAQGGYYSTLFTAIVLVIFVIAFRGGITCLLQRIAVLNSGK